LLYFISSRTSFLIVLANGFARLRRHQARGRRALPRNRRAPSGAAQQQRSAQSLSNVPPTLALFDKLREHIMIALLVDQVRTNGYYRQRIASSLDLSLPTFLKSQSQIRLKEARKESPL